MHGSFLAHEFVQGQLWGTPKSLKAVDEVFVGYTPHTSRTVIKKSVSVAFLRSAVCDL